MALALIDADSIYFRAAYANNSKKEMRTIINNTMHDITGQCFCTDDEVRVAVKGKGNFRKDLYPAYKGNRPVLADDVKERLNYGHTFMKEKWNAVQADGMEADDLVSIWAYEAREMEEQYVVVGIDKDLKQIPGNHYNFGKKIHDFVDDDQADYNLMLQCLTGDTSDNIPGIKGIGPKKAEKILKDIPLERRWNRVRASWRAHSAGCPKLSLRLLSMVKTWEELEEVQLCVQKKTEGLIRGSSASGSNANPSPSTQPTSGSEEGMS